MITLTFAPLTAGSQLVMRAAFFRIGPDARLRGPESTLVASYVSHMWQVGARRFREFHCNDVVYLRVSSAAGEHRQHGPYQYVRVAAGGLFVNGACLGIHSPILGADQSVDHWHDVTLLSAAGAAPLR